MGDRRMGDVRKQTFSARRNVRALLIWSRREEVGRGWNASLPSFVWRRGPVGVQSSSAAGLGRCWGFTRAVLECLNGNFGSLFGHAELTAGEPEIVLRFMCEVE
jgi:hypothetical protein